MAWVSYHRQVTGLSGKVGESMRCPEKWQIRVDSPLTPKPDILAGVTATIGITYGSPHWDFPDLQAQEFALEPETSDGMLWTLTVQFYVPPPGKTYNENGIPEDVWERSGGTTTIPVYKSPISGLMITNSAGDPLEGLEKEREETSWSLTKYYDDEESLNADIDACAGHVNSAEWAGYTASQWKCYFKGAKKSSVSRLDGEDDAGKLSFIESRWEFRLDDDQWIAKPWNVGFMELVSGQRKAILGSDGKPVKQPVALNSNGTAKAAGQAPSALTVLLYPTADFAAVFGEPAMLPVEEPPPEEPPPEEPPPE